MQGQTLLISDLHLDPERPGINELFLRFLEQDARGSDALYILGDLFEVWLGDDEDDPQVLRLVGALRQLADSGTPVFVMHGNRDFLLGEGFARQARVQLLPDPSIVSLYGRPTLLMHGDLLCTRDTDYLRFRRQVRAADWQRDFLARSLAERRRIAAELRRTSRTESARKAADIMDVTPSEVERYLSYFGVHRLIHGHTHRPGVHHFQYLQTPATRTVLGDWYTQGSVLRCTAQRQDLETLSVPG